MNRAVTRIDIDRVVLDGLEITPEQADRLRSLLEAELARRLGSGSLMSLKAQQASHREAPPVQFDRAGGMERLATDLASSVMDAIGAGVAPAKGAGHV